MVTIAPTEMKMSTTNQNTLNAIHLTLGNGIRAGKSKAARKWLADRGLSIELTHAGFSSGQMHHRQSEEMLVRLMLVDFIKLSTAPTNTGKNGYTSFAKESIVFTLENEKGEPVNFYAIKIHADQPKGEYLNQSGVYPCYPPPLTTRLFLTSNVLDAASLLESRVLENRDAVLALNDGLFTEHHQRAIEPLQYLTEIILIG